MEKKYAYIGNWTMPFNEGTECGVFSASLEDDGSFLRTSSSARELCCGQMDYSKKLSVLYCVNERPEVPGETYGGQIYAFKVNLDGSLKEISRNPSYGTLPCYCRTDPTGKYLIVTHHSAHGAITKTVQDSDGKYRTIKEYDETGIVLFSLHGDGSIGDVCDIFRLEGHSILEKQTHPHAHSVNFSPDGSFFIVCDKGSDKVLSFRIDYETGRIVQISSLDILPGSSPRYSVFHPFLPFVYTNNETKSYVNAFHYDSAGNISMSAAVCANLDLIPERNDMQGDILIHPTGKYLYDMLRGSKTIALFDIGMDGIPKLRSEFPSGSNDGGRCFTISPDGDMLYMESNKDGCIYGYSILKDGSLSPGHIVFKEGFPANMIIA